MKTTRKGNQEWSIEYPERPFFIYPRKCNELFLLIPICFVMFFLKGGGWFYSICLLIAWFVFAAHWSQKYWECECQQAKRFKLFHGDEWINRPNPADFHQDSQYHKHDELHFLYKQNSGWESHQEFKERWKDDPDYILLMEKHWRQKIMEGR